LIDEGFCRHKSILARDAFNASFGLGTVRGQEVGETFPRS